MYVRVTPSAALRAFSLIVASLVGTVSIATSLRAQHCAPELIESRPAHAGGVVGPDLTAKTLELAQGDNVACPSCFAAKNLDLVQPDSVVFEVRFTLRGARLGGKMQQVKWATQQLVQEGDIDGTFNEPSLKFVVRWKNGSKSVYELTIDGHGFMMGETYDFYHQDRPSGITSSPRLDSPVGPFLGDPVDVRGQAIVTQDQTRRGGVEAKGLVPCGPQREGASHSTRKKIAKDS